LGRGRNPTTKPGAGSTQPTFEMKFHTRGVMKTLNLKKVYTLLDTRNIPGSEKELEILCTRISELVRLNGEKWVEQNRQKLLKEWRYIVQQSIIS
jgi:hypothetical protein